MVLFASLLWPTFFMGVSLPLLARALTEDLDRAAVRIGQLYGFNTLGAAAGALVSTWLLLPRVGFGGALWIGGATNLVCALMVLTWLRDAPRAAAAAPRQPRAGSTPAIAGQWRPAFMGWATLFGLSGFLALSLEIVWFRLLGVIVKSTAFTFGDSGCPRSWRARSSRIRARVFRGRRCCWRTSPEESPARC